MPAAKKKTDSLSRKPTKTEVEYGRLRAAASGIPANTSAKGLRTAGKAVALVAVNAIPTGRLAKTAAKFASVTKAKKLTSGASKVKTKTFTQGERSRITNTTSKKSGSASYSPTKGTKVKVEYKTKELSPKQQAVLTTGKVVREKGSKAGTYAKGASTGAIAENLRTSSKNKKK